MRKPERPLQETSYIAPLSSRVSVCAAFSGRDSLRGDTQKDIPQVRNPPGGDGHHVTYRDMTASELAEREARQLAYEAMLARQAAYERERWATVDKKSPYSA
nr:hypothetical protein GCM10020185_18740 [Pseudomonas brassicacearum subsp. brassicacearum]